MKFCEKYKEYTFRKNNHHVESFDVEPCNIRLREGVVIP